MKKFIFISIVTTLFSLTAKAQNYAVIDSLSYEIKFLRQELYKTYSLTKSYIDEMYKRNDMSRYKMYQTENTYNLLKLDTKTGAVWQVQYRMKGVKPQIIPIEYSSYLKGIVSESEGCNGRFELYPTKNMYTFILLDTKNGNTYQVQWGTDSDYRFIERLY